MKYKERIAKWNKAFYSQFDIVEMMNLKDFEFKEFIVNVKDISISHKGMNAWRFSQAFESKKLLAEFMFFFYQHNFYPRGGWADFSNNHTQFEAVKKRLEAALEEGVKPK